MSGYTYLASPYSSPDEAVRLRRFEAAAEAAARMMREGRVVFSPIAHSHPIDAFFPEPESGEFWHTQDVHFLRHADRMAVLMLHGWRESKGIARELAVARELHIPVEYIEP